MLQQADWGTAGSEDVHAGPRTHPLPAAELHRHQEAEAQTYNKLQGHFFRTGAREVPPSHGLPALPRPVGSAHQDRSSKIPPTQELKEIIYQVVETLAYLHSHKVCHRDIKPENILYDLNKKSVKLVDFGISKKLIKRGIKRDMLTLTGTPYYRAPEMF